MKLLRFFNASIPAALVLAGLSVCRADIIYRDTFERVGSLNGSAPTVDNTGNSVTWSGHANFTTDGTNCIIPAQENWQWPAIGLPIDMGYFWDTTISCDVKLDNDATGDWVGIGYGPVGDYWNQALYMTLAGNGTVNAYIGPPWGIVMQLVTNAAAGIPGGWNTIAIQYSNYNATASIIVNGVYLAQDVDIPLSGASGVNLLQFNNGGAKIANFKVTMPPDEEVAPSIVTQPAGKQVFYGDPVTLSVLANGSLPLKYQWRTNGIDIPGANSATYPIPAATNSADYTVVVTNGVGAKTSDVARVVAHLTTNVTLAEINFDDIQPAGWFGYSYYYSSTNVPLSSSWSVEAGEGVDTSAAGRVSGDGSGFAGVQVDWAGLAGVMHLPITVNTAYLPAYQYSFDARVENLVPETVTSTGCRMTVTFTANAGTNFTAISGVRAITLSSNYQHFTFTLDTADYGGPTALAWFAQNLQFVNGVEFSISADSFASQFVNGPGCNVFMDNLKMVQRVSPPITVTQNGAGQAFVEWPDPDTTLQRATSAAGPYLNVEGATSPYPVPASETPQFFRTVW